MRPPSERNRTVGSIRPAQVSARERSLVQFQPERQSRRQVPAQMRRSSAVERSLLVVGEGLILPWEGFLSQDNHTSISRSCASQGEPIVIHTSVPCRFCGTSTASAVMGSHGYYIVTCVADEPSTNIALPTGLELSAEDRAAQVAEWAFQWHDRGTL